MYIQLTMIKNTITRTKLLNPINYKVPKRTMMSQGGSGGKNILSKVTPPKSPEKPTNNYTNTTETEFTQVLVVNIMKADQIENLDYTPTSKVSSNAPNANKAALPQNMSSPLAEQVQHITPGVYKGPVKKENEFHEEIQNNTQIPKNIRMHLKDPMKAYVKRDNKEESNLERPSVLEKTSVENFQQQNIVEDPIIAIRLKENARGDTKHVNFGEFNEKGTGVISYGAATSSEDHDKITGKSTSKKLSSVKMDDSFIKEAIVIAVEKKGENQPDFIAGIAISQKTSGQRMRVFEKPREYNSSEYDVSVLGMEYMENNPDAEQNIKDIISEKKKRE